MTYVVDRTYAGAAYGIGDRVQFNDLCSAQALRGSMATIVRKSRVRLTVKLDKPIGEYSKDVDGVRHSIDTIVPFSIVDLVG